MSGATHVCSVPKFSVGDQPPSGYIDWHEWAKVQHRGGLRQKRRPCCGKWKFPQEQCAHEGAKVAS